jgi:hypothetical protein
MGYRNSSRRTQRSDALSDDAEDKTYAAMSWHLGKSKSGPDYVRAPFYFDACWAWYQRLSEDHRDLVTYVIDAFAYPNMRREAERLASELPPAPRCPL